MWLLQVVACLVTIASMWRIGDKHWTGPALGLVGDVTFLAINVSLQLWLLAALTLVISVIHVRNFIKWTSPV